MNSIQTRIANIRSVLENADSLTDISVEGISETVNRESLQSELSDLERKETELLGITKRVNRIDLTRL